MLETDLPEPDSPTMPSVLPSSTEYDRSETAWTRPSAVGNLTVRSSTTRYGSPAVGGDGHDSLTLGSSTAVDDVDEMFITTTETARTNEVACTTGRSLM